MGTVFLARDLILEQDVALKIIKCEEDFDYRRFQQEVLAARKISSKYVVKTFECGYESNNFYIVTEYVEGGDLKSYLVNSSLSLFEKIEIFKGIVAGLIDIHSENIIHRDIKLSNILYSTKEGIPKIGDLGIVKFVGGNITKKDDFIGSPTHMAPELWKGQEPTSSLDIYALGILAFELFVEDLPFDKSNLSKVINFHVNVTPPKLSTFGKNPSLSLLDDIVSECLAKTPELRPTARQIFLRLHRLELREKTYFELPAPALKSKIRNKALFKKDEILITTKNLDSSNSPLSVVYKLSTLFAFCLLFGFVLLTGYPNIVSATLFLNLGENLPVLMASLAVMLALAFGAVFLLKVSVLHFVAFSLGILIFSLPSLSKSLSVELLAPDYPSYIYSLSIVSKNFFYGFFENFSPIVNASSFFNYLILFVLMILASFITHKRVKGFWSLFFCFSLIFILLVNLLNLLIHLEGATLGFITICFLAYSTRLALNLSSTSYLAPDPQP